jgi:hypothetical protein
VPGLDDLPGAVGDDVGRDREPDPDRRAAELGSAAARVGTPKTRPDRSTRAPPLFPGLIAAEVWIASGSVAPGDPFS